MVSAFDLSLTFVAVVVGLLSLRLPRAMLWIGLAMVDFWASHFYWDAGLPYAEAFTGACDAGICLALYFAAKERWELGVWRLFQLSVAVNFLFLASNLGIINPIDIDAYSIVEEAINWLMLLLIFGLWVGQYVGGGDGVDFAHRPWRRVHSLVRALHESRKTPSFLAIR